HPLDHAAGGPIAHCAVEEVTRCEGAKALEAQAVPRLEPGRCHHAGPLEELRELLAAAADELAGAGARESADHGGAPPEAAAHWSRSRAHVNASTAERAWRAIRRARSGYSRTTVSALASATGSSGGTTSPVSPSRTSAAMSPVAVETTGSPAANASSTDSGWLSMIDELTKTSAAS